MKKQKVPDDAQIAFLDRIRVTYKSKKLFIEALAKLLNVSESGIYRRLRAEIKLSTAETKSLQERYPAVLPLEKYRSDRTTKLEMEYSDYDPVQHNLLHQLGDMLRELSIAKSDKQAMIYYMAADIPLFQLFYSKELTAFYFYLLKKLVLEREDYIRKTFILADELLQPEVAEAQKLYDLYQQLPGCELWSKQTTAQLLTYLHEMRQLKNIPHDADYSDLQNAFTALLNNVEQQAGQGHKFDIQKPLYELYLCNMLNKSNESLFVVFNTPIVFKMHNEVEILMIQNSQFGQRTLQHYKKIIARSKQLSKVNPIERQSFFNELKRLVNL